MKVISVYNKKGGVGKTTTVMAMASYLTEFAHKRVLVVDLDSQRNLTQGYSVKDSSPSSYELLIKEEPLLKCIRVLKADLTEDKKVKRLNLGLIPSTKDVDKVPTQLSSEMGAFANLKEAIESSPNLDQIFDYIILDCPPAYNLITVNALTASDYVIIAALPEQFSIAAVEDTDKMMKDIKKYGNPNVKVAGVLITKRKLFGKNDTLVFKNTVSDLKKITKEIHNAPVFESMIRDSTKVGESQRKGIPLLEYDPECPVAKDYISFMEELLKIIEEN